MKKTYLAGAVAVAALLAGGAWWWNSTRAPAVAPMILQASGGGEMPADMVPAMVQGRADAPVTIVEYASFTCPHCKDFYDRVLPQVKAEWIDTGKAKLEFREFYLNQFDLAAATITQCGGEMRYFGIVDILFDEQADWPAGGDPQAAAQKLLNIAKRAGLSDEQARACMSDAELRNRLVATFQYHASQDQVTGTPTFFINGTRQPNAAYPEFARVLEAEYAKVAPKSE